MHHLVQLMQEGGPAMYGLLLIALVAPAAMIAGTALAATRRWSPAPLWWGLPALAALVGAGGWLQGLVMLREALVFCAPEVRNVMLHAGLGVAVVPAMVGMALGAVVLALSAQAAGVGLAVGASSGRSRSAAAGLALLVGLGGAILVLAVALMQPHILGTFGPEAALLPLLVAGGGLAVGLTLLREPEEESAAARVTAGRLVVASMVAGSIALAYGAAALHGQHGLHLAFAHAHPDALPLQPAVAWASARAWLLPSAAALLLAVLGGGLACATDLPRLIIGRSLSSAGITALGLLVAGGALAGAWSQHSPLQAQANEALLQRVLATGRDLPSTVLPRDGEAANPRMGHFSVVFSWEHGAWRPASPGAELPLPADSDELPLLVAPGSLPVADLVDTRWAGTAGVDALVDLEIAVATPRDPPLAEFPWSASLGAGSVPLTLVPPSLVQENGAVHPSETMIITAEGATLALFKGRGTFTPIVDLAATLEGLPEPPSGKAWDLLLVPGPTWTLQDLVGWCRALGAAHPDERFSTGHVPQSCLVTSRNPAFLATATSPLAPALQQPAEPERIVPHLIVGPALSGALDQTQIAQVMRRASSQFKYCWERALKVQPSLGGRVDLRFVIGPEGRVTSAEIASSTLANQDVEGCVLTHVRRLRFPAPQGGGVVAVTYPLVFSVAD